MEFKPAYLGMIKAFSGGWDAMCGAMGMTRSALTNRIYANKGQGMDVDEAMQMQVFSGTKLFAEAVAAQSGGVFVMLPEFENSDDDSINDKFHRLLAHLGELSKAYTEATKDGEVCKRERAELETIGNEIHKTTQQLLAITFRVYCRS